MAKYAVYFEYTTVNADSDAEAMRRAMDCVPSPVLVVRLPEHPIPQQSGG